MKNYTERIGDAIGMLKGMLTQFESEPSREFPGDIETLTRVIDDVEMVGLQYAAGKLRARAAIVEAGLTSDGVTVGGAEVVMQEAVPLWGAMRLLEQVEWECFHAPEPEVRVDVKP